MAKRKITGEQFSMTLLVEQESIVKADSQDQIRETKERFKFDAANYANQQGLSDSDLIPKPEDFVLFPFRLISATILGADSWKATDFSNAKMLKASAPLLKNKPAYVNHDVYVGNEIGIIGDTQWNNGFSAPDGTKVPGGIDGPYVIDSKLFPALVRKMNSPMSPIQSSSVTVLFDWESSHEFENDNDFYYHIGEEINGEMVRRVATKVNDYIESSLVYMGADPFAKKKDSAGNLINIDKSSIVSNMKFDKDPMSKLYTERKELYIWDCFGKEKTIPLREKIFISAKKEDPKPDNIMKDLQNFIAGKLGVKPEDVTVEMLNNFSISKTEDFSALTEKAKKVDTLEADKTKLEGEKTELNKKVTALEADVVELKKSEPMVAFAKKVMDAKRKECVDTYSKSVGGKPEQVIVDEINACADEKSLDAKMKFFGVKLIENYKPVCSGCGSDNVNFRSSAEEGQGEEGNVSGNSTDLTTHFRN